MSWKDLFMYVAALVIVAGFVYAFGPLGAITIYGVFGAMMAVGLACSALAIAVIGYGVIFASGRYIKRLQEAGYHVEIDRHEVQNFAIMALVALIFLPMASYHGLGVWESHLCVQAGECTAPEGWYRSVLITTGLLALMALYALGCVTWQWYSSFRPIRRAYQELQLGHDPGLPRLP